MLSVLFRVNLISISQSFSCLNCGSTFNVSWIILSTIFKNNFSLRLNESSMDFALASALDHPCPIISACPVFPPAEAFLSGTPAICSIFWYKESTYICESVWFKSTSTYSTSPLLPCGTLIFIMPFSLNSSNFSGTISQFKNFKKLWIFCSIPSLLFDSTLLIAFKIECTGSKAPSLTVPNGYSAIGNWFKTWFSILYFR